MSRFAGRVVRLEVARRARRARARAELAAVERLIDQPWSRPASWRLDRVLAAWEPWV